MSKARRGLFRSPFSAEKEPKRSRKGDDSKEVDTVAQAEGKKMEEDRPNNTSKEGRESLIDTQAFHEIVMTRINEALSAFAPQERSDPAMKILPAFATAVSLAMVEVMKGVLDMLDQRLEKMERREIPAAGQHEEKLEAAIRSLTYENDRLQQYTRRESVRIFGVTQDSDETAEQVERKALTVMQEAGVEVGETDIAACHRVGKTGKGPRAVLVKFVSRRKRRELMMKKKTLKGKKGYDRIFINDDLTPLRSRLLGYVKSLPDVERAWTVDGKIRCQKRSIPGLHPEDRPSVVTIETPDDLFRLGVTELDYQRLGLTHLVFAGNVAGNGVRK